MKKLDDDVLLKNCDIMFINPTLDPVYKNCLTNEIKTIKQLLSAYHRGNLELKNKKTRIQLEGVIDLIKYKYFGELSEEILFILNKSFSFSLSPLNYYHFPDDIEELFRRLGFNTSQFDKIAILNVKKKENTITDKTTIISLLDCNDFIQPNLLSQNIRTKISLLRDMYLQSLQVNKKNTNEEQQDNSQTIFLPNSEKAKEIGKIRLENSGIICTDFLENPIYQYCLLHNCETIEDFFNSYSELFTYFYSADDQLYLQAIYELIRTQYFGLQSNKILTILGQNFSVEEKKDKLQFSLQTRNNLRRLGFLKSHIDIIEKQVINHKNRNQIKILDYLLEEQKKKDTVPYKIGSIQTTFYHLVDLLVNQYHPEDVKLKEIAHLKEVLENLKFKIATLNTAAQEVQKEIDTLQQECDKNQLSEEIKKGSI